MGQPATRGSYCHVFLNGQYLGLFDTCERPEASFGAAHFGGRKEDLEDSTFKRTYNFADKAAVPYRNLLTK